MDDFWLAAKNGDIERLDSLIVNGEDHWSHGLSGACAGGHLDLVHFMISKGACNWESGLICACECKSNNGNMDIINLMISNGAKCWSVALFSACLKNNTLVVEFLVKNKSANIDWTLAFDGACQGGHINLMQFLIKKSKGNIDYDYSLFGACCGGHDAVIDFLISKGATDWNAGFRGACSGGHIKLVEFCISKGANHFDHGVRHACLSGHLNVVKFIILKSKAEKFGLDLVRGFEESCKNGHLSIVKFLFDKLVELAKVDKLVFYINQSLSQAMTRDFTNVIHFLMSNGATDISKHYTYPKCKNSILKLLILGTPLDAFSKINGYQDLTLCISNVKRSILGSNAVISDLLSIISKCIII